MKRFIVYGSGLLASLFFIIVVLVLITPPPPVLSVKPAPETQSVAASLVWANEHKLLAQKNGELKIYPASTTKMLTCIMALEEGKQKLDTPVVITPLAMGQDGTLVCLSPNKPLTLHELLYGMMLISGNDAAVAVAETVGGSYQHFVDMMNEKATSIGVTHSHFMNPSGLTDKEHYSTANDMVYIAAYAMKNPEFRDIVSKPIYPMSFIDGTVRVVENRNEFLSSGYTGANGVKTGMTDAAGECLVASAERNGQLVIVSIYNDKARWQDVKNWLDYGFYMVDAYQQYEKELAAEPIVYKRVNQLMGKEPYEK